MKIILKEEYPSLGVIGEVVKVADGYARNYLLPRGIAVVATKGTLKQYEAMQDVILVKRAKVKSVAEVLSEKLGALELSFTRKSGEGGKLFGSVTSIDIAAALKEEGFEIDKKYIRLDEHIKTIGVVAVPIKIHSEVPANVNVKVIGEGYVEEVAEEEIEAAEDVPETESAEEATEAVEETAEAPVEEAPAEAVSDESAE